MSFFSSFLSRQLKPNLSIQYLPVLLWRSGCYRVKHALADQFSKVKMACAVLKTELTNAERQLEHRELDSVLSARILVFFDKSAC